MTVYRGYVADDSVVCRSNYRRVSDWSTTSIDDAVERVTADFHGRVRNPLQAQFRDHPGTYRNVYQAVDPVDPAARNPTIVEFVGPHEGQGLGPSLGLYKIMAFEA